ncbi:MAG: hypothetical protein WD751_04145 [Anaerolineales bacterium]
MKLFEKKEDVVKYPCWQPGGGKIAYTNLQFNICLFDLDSEETLKFDRTPEGVIFADQPAWSPDGKFIYFIYPGEKSRLEAMDVEGHKLIRIVTSEREINEFVFSRDGSKIAYIESGSKKGSVVQNLVVINSDGSNSQNVVHIADLKSETFLMGLRSLSQVSWVGSDRLIFVKEKSVYSIDLNSGKQNKLINDCLHATGNPVTGVISFLKPDMEFEHYINIHLLDSQTEVRHAPRSQELIAPTKKVPLPSRPQFMASVWSKPYRSFSWSPNGMKVAFGVIQHPLKRNPLLKKKYRIEYGSENLESSVCVLDTFTLKVTDVMSGGLEALSLPSWNSEGNELVFCGGQDLELYRIGFH